MGDSEIPTRHSTGDRNKQGPFDFRQRLDRPTTGEGQRPGGDPAADRKPARPPAGQRGEQRELCEVGQRGPLVVGNHQVHRPIFSLRVGRFGIRVLEHLRDDQPRSIGLTLQRAK